MSDQIKNSAGIAGGGPQQGNSTFYHVEVKCPRPTYRRAGFSLVRGKNTLENVSPEQLAILRADSVLHLALVSEAPVSPDGESRGLDVLGVGNLSDRIRDAVMKLDKTNPEHFTQAGNPRVAAVCTVLGETITGEQLKAAMNQSDEG